jgi:hypothetical protein
MLPGPVTVVVTVNGGKVTVPVKVGVATVTTTPIARTWRGPPASGTKTICAAVGGEPAKVKVKTCGVVVGDDSSIPATLGTTRSPVARRVLLLLLLLLSPWREKENAPVEMGTRPVAVACPNTAGFAFVIALVITMPPEPNTPSVKATPPPFAGTGTSPAATHVAAPGKATVSVPVSVTVVGTSFGFAQQTGNIGPTRPSVGGQGRAQFCSIVLFFFFFLFFSSRGEFFFSIQRHF